MKKKIIISSILLANLLVASNNFKLATINKQAIDLYEKPSNTSKKTQNYFKQNEKIKIYSCNKSSWCKTDNGYVKFYLVKMLKDDVVIKKSEVIEEESKTKKVLLSEQNNNKINNLIEQNNIFKKELNKIKLENIIIKNKLQEVKKVNKSQNEFLDELDINMDDVGKNTYANKVSFSLNTQFEVNQPDIKYTNNHVRENQSQIFRTRLRINMKARINEYIKFYGRLSSYKNWGDSNEDKTLFASMDAKQGRTPDNTSVAYVERVYVDWRLNPASNSPIFLTIGRQPSSNGPSYQIKDGTSRKGTYDSLAFDGAADGIILTYIKDEYNSLRIAYGVPNNGNSYNEKMKDTRVLGLFYDRKFKSLNQKHLFQAYGSIAKNMMGYPNLYDANGQSMDKNLGDIYLLGLMFEMKDVNKFNYFFHYAKSRTKPNNNRVDLTQFNMTNKEGLLSSGDDYSSKDGHAFWLGVKYNYNKQYSYGIEYNQGSQNWFSFAFSSDDPINKLQTRGKAAEVYVINNINKQSSITFGYIKIKYDYTNSGVWLGAARPISDMNFGFIKKEQSNIYLKMNFKF